MTVLDRSAIRKRIEIHGVVQGVGFRPFVYRLAKRFEIVGSVLNSSEGVVIEAEAGARSLDLFLDALPCELPPLARIDQMTVADQMPRGDREFRIANSSPQPGRFALVPVDVATCPECLTDLTDAGNRRFGYPFTNCTNCGPRYSIIRDVPYDRPNTTMAEFPLCPSCRREYEDPSDRRFHAEPNACPDCGPSLSLLGRNDLTSSADILARTRQLLREGNILAIKGLGGFHLACDASNSAAVDLLRERKRRSGKAFAVMVASLKVAERLCILDDAERALLTSYRRPIVLLRRRTDCSVPSAVAPGNGRLGLMLPYTPLHHLLFDGHLDALVMTSGNMSEEPIVSRNEEARPRLHTLADHFLLHDRSIRTRLDDSVLQIFEGREYPVRRSRGYAPEPISLAFSAPEILACGGELKNTFCLTKDRYAILSQHIGDLENLETMDFFRETLDHLQRFFRVSPVAIAHDLHPGYLSTRFALEESGLQAIGVQHHHAHIASCMADNGIDGPVIGIALDGTGYGTDGRIWGGEALICDFKRFDRRGHLRYVPLAGGDTAVRQPWRSALAYCRDAGLLPPPFEGVPPNKIRVVDRMLNRGIQTVDTSSCGRLFDAVSSLLGIRHETSYEGQAAIELETAATVAQCPYPFAVHDGSPFEIDLRPTIQAIITDIANAVAIGEISARFHLTMAQVVADMCERLRVTDGLNRVCLSGGTFQNLRLLTQSVGALRDRGFQVFTHHRVPTNDGALALGQAAIAASLLRS
jgi:hydrogenase maturation protein HypF